MSISFLVIIFRRVKVIRTKTDSSIFPSVDAKFFSLFSFFSFFFFLFFLFFLYLFSSWPRDPTMMMSWKGFKEEKRCGCIDKCN